MKDISSQLDKQDIFLIKVIVFVILSILVGAIFYYTGSIWSVLAYIPTMPYVIWTEEFWRK
jgi:hypothetical protein